MNELRAVVRRWLLMKRKLLFLALGLLLSSCTSHPNAPLLSVPPSAAAEDYVYIADAAGRIRAIRPDGKEQWSYTLADDLRRQNSAASYDLQITYLTARSGGKLFGLATELTGRYAGEIILFALDGQHLLWQTSAPAPEPGVMPVAIGQTAVYEAGDDGVLYAFARADGHPLWQYRVSQGALGSPTIGADGTIYVTGPRHNLHAIAPDGAQRWVLQTDE
jgi:outer membrane protein assembly factor BamB